MNPYQPPADVGPNFPPDIVDGASIVARCERRRWASRTLILTGDLNAELRYLTWTPGESVILNGKKIGKAKGNYITAVCPRIDFFLPMGDGVVPAAILARASYLQLLRIIEFRLVIDDRVVYDDLAYRV